MPYAPTSPITHLPGTAIALGLESGRNSGWWRFQRVFGLIALLVGLGIALLMAGTAISMFTPGSGVIPLLVFVVFAGFCAWRLRGRFAGSTRGIPRLPDAAARVGVVGPESELRKLLQTPAIREETFEPVVIKIGPAWYVYPALALSMFGSGAIVVFTSLQSGRGIQRLWPFIFLSSYVPIWAFMFAFSRYARLVPGRLDILQGSFLGRRLRLRHSYDLRTPAVLVDLNDRCLLLIHPGGRTQAIHLPAEKERAALVPEILRAAISTATAAPLPDDALVG
ncbi:MAG: hypothetical protein K2Q20_09595 [Phycisphaerales bacterium]|nr:hypothetical protein [Phycisphaerales bacterium]